MPKKCSLRTSDGEFISLELIPGDMSTDYRTLGYCSLKISTGSQSWEAPMSPFMLEKLSSMVLL